MAMNVPWWGWLTIWLVIIILAISIYWYWKNVLVPTLTLNTDKASYDRSEVVQITGNLKQGTTPLTGKTVSLAIQPPSGDAYALPAVVTDTSGNFASSWEIPDAVVGGTYTLTASSSGVSASKTFRRNQQIGKG